VRLLRHQRIVCAAGEHRCSVVIAAVDLLRIAEPRVADICQHPEERFRTDEPPAS
jgi:prolyl-tRNA editing enzyme YbaK/EbsC (Cys-tRNA(Pro) deacylase)